MRTIMVAAILFLALAVSRPIHAAATPAVVHQGNSITRTSDAEIAKTDTIFFDGQANYLLVVTQQDGTGGTPIVESAGRDWSVVLNVGRLRQQTVFMSFTESPTSGPLIITSPASTDDANSFSWSLVRVDGQLGQVNTTLSVGGLDPVGRVALPNSSQTLAGFAFLRQQSVNNVSAGEGYTLLGRPSVTPTLWTQLEWRGTPSDEATMRWMRSSHYVAWAIEVLP
jgi:hypothetical protein